MSGAVPLPPPPCLHGVNRDVYLFVECIEIKKEETCNIVPLSRNIFCHGRAGVFSLCTVDEHNVAVSNMNRTYVFM
jgi:hypothetical protein